MYATLIDTVTGEQKRVDRAKWDASVWAWTEGNFSCDCNRGMMFGIYDHPCGESRFRIIAVHGHLESYGRSELIEQVVNMIRVERYRDGGSLRITDDHDAFVFDQAFSFGPTYGKWLTDWPEKGGHVVEQGTQEYQTLVDTITRYNQQKNSEVRINQIPLP